MNLPQDMIKQWTEDFQQGRLNRRDFLRRVATVAGGAALAVVAFDREAIPAPAATAPAPVVWTGVDSNNNFVLNGQPMLLIQGETLDYASWKQAGYTTAQADAKIAQAKAAGLNVIVGNWFGEDLALWQKHGIYWHGYCLRDLGAGIDCRGAWHTPNTLPSSCAPRVVAAHASQPNLIAWMLDGEFELDSSVTSDPQGYVNTYVQASNYIKSIDPAKRVSFTTLVNAGPWGYALRSDANQLAMVECVIVFGSPWIGLAKLWNVLKGFNGVIAKNPGGLGWVPCVSTTVVKELLSYTGAAPWRSFDEGNRYFWMQVAMNCRAFDVLWGPNTRDLSLAPNNGDAGLPVGFLNIWDWTWQIIKNIKSLESIILAPGNWTQIPTTPTFVPWDGVRTWAPNKDILFKGIYAAKKTVSGKTYVIAVNCQEDDKTGSELPLHRARINVGQTFRRAKRLFDHTWTAQASPHFEPNVSSWGEDIIQDFEPMQVHVYELSESET